MTRPTQILIALFLLAGLITGCGGQNHPVSPQGDDPETATQRSESANAKHAGPLTGGIRLAKLAAANCFTNTFSNRTDPQTVYTEGAMRYEAVRDFLRLSGSNMMITSRNRRVTVSRIDGQPFTLQSLDVVLAQGLSADLSSTGGRVRLRRGTLTLPSSFSGITSFTIRVGRGRVVIDNVVICSATIQVDVDIKPGSDSNSINLKSKGVIPVAILTTDDFDASTVDGSTVVFEGASPDHGSGHLEDVDGDGDVDWVGHFRTQDTGLTETSTSGSLTGKDNDGTDLEGSDSVRITPGSSKGKK